MNENKAKVVIIGNGALVILCSEYLLDNGFIISVIVVWTIKSTRII